MEKSKRPRSNLAPRRRFEPALDMNRSSSSLNVSTSSLRSAGGGEEEVGKDGGAAAVQATRRPAGKVRFAPPPPRPQQAAVARPATPIAATRRRPASSSGPPRRSGLSAGGVAGASSEPGPKALRRSWGWTSGVDSKEQGTGDPVPVVAKIVAKTESRSSSAPRRLPHEEKEKPLPKRASKIITTTRTKADHSPPKPDKEGSTSPPNVPRKTSDRLKSPDVVPLKNTDMTSPPSRTSVTTIGASWECLPSDLQSLGLEVMRYRDDAEVAAVEALKEASAAEILLRCLSAFADLASAAAEQSPQQTVDEFLALQAALARSAAVHSDQHRKQDRHAHAGDWLRAAVSADLAPFSLYYSPAGKPGGETPLAAAAVPFLSSPPSAAAGEPGAEEAWLEAARSGLGEEMRAWFLGHVERLLDGDVAGTLGQLKRVNDWLDAAGGGPPGSGSESEAVERVRRKIYGYLLDHVESAVVALNGAGFAPGRRK